jgi:hypothetical protein
MSLFQNISTGEVREIDDGLMAAWIAAGNPKAQEWAPYTPAPPEPAAPVPDWTDFTGWLYGFPAMAEAMATARASSDPQGEPVTTGLPTAMNEARANQDYPVFAMSWAVFLAASGLSPEHLAEIVAKATACHLPEPFIEALQPPT